MSDSAGFPSGVTTFSTWVERSSGTELRVVGTRDRVEDLKLAQRLAAFDRARSAEERRAAQRRILELGRSAIPSVLAELSTSQPPDRADVLLALFVSRESPDTAIAAAKPASPWALRAAMAEALARFAAASSSHEPRHRVAVALSALARDTDIGVRSTAIDAIGLAGVTDEPGIRELLSEAASTDPDPGVRAEANAILEESE